MCIVICLHACQYEGVGSPEGRVTGSCELPRGYWELSPHPLEEQSVLSTTETSLQPPMSLSIF